MSQLKVNRVQIGQSNTTTQNFSLEVPAEPDGTIKLARGLAGATTQDVLTVDASGKVAAPQGFIGSGEGLTSLPVQFAKETIAATAITYGSTITISHSLGTVPSGLMLKLRCKTADASYAVNDVIYWSPAGDAFGSNAGCSVTLTSTNIALRFSANGIYIINKTTFATALATAANWEIIGDIIK